MAPLLAAAVDAPGLDYKELQGGNTPRKALACPPRNHPKRINFSNVVLVFSSIILASALSDSIGLAVSIALQES